MHGGAEDIGAVLKAIPDEWRGTTFDNSELLGRVKFVASLEKLLASKAPVCEESLMALGNAEDYLRVATNLSTVLEFFLSRDKGFGVQQVFTFASDVMPLAAILLTATAGAVVHLYHGSAEPPFTPAQLSILSQLGSNPQLHVGAPPTATCALPAATDLVLWWVGRDDHVFDARTCPLSVDAVIAPCGVLYIISPRRIDTDAIAVVRKRMATPATTPMCEAMLRRLSERSAIRVSAAELALELAADDSSFRSVTPQELTALHTHLQALCGAPIDRAPLAQPRLFTAGLPALASLWLALLRGGGADIVMCSTAYGGSSQLTDLLSARSQQRTIGGAGPTSSPPAPELRKHTFGIQGDADVVASIDAALTTLGEAHGGCFGKDGRRDDATQSSSSLMPTTVLFVEMPTNPDMKVPNLSGLVSAICNFQRAYRLPGGVFTPRVLLLIDATLAPCCKPLEALSALAPNLPAIVFLSLSKSVSRGLTTAGALVPNGSAYAHTLMQSVAQTSAALDTGASADQVRRLVDHHEGVETRCAQAYAVAAAAADELIRCVREKTAVEMRLSFVTREQAEGSGCLTSTFSFNLPPPCEAEEAAEADVSEAIKAGLAQRFVDLLTSSRPKLFKPCVSFGQDNGLVYCTVPATSTQGAIKAEDKAKQAVGGVQLVRLSFPPTIDLGLVRKAIREAVSSIYEAGPKGGETASDTGRRGRLPGVQRSAGGGNGNGDGNAKRRRR